MKKILLLAFVGAMSLSLYAGTKLPVVLTAIPQALQDTIAAHFTQDQILAVTYEKTLPKHFEYEFRLGDGTKLKYNEKAKLLKIENENGIDLSFVPKGIKDYVYQTFPNATIVEYKNGIARQDVELNIGIDLIFDKGGRFLRLTD